jgi:hypothetical protein
MAARHSATGKNVKKDAKPKAAKGAKGAKGGAAKSTDVKLTSHPRARRQIARLKSWGGLAGFGVAGYLSYKNGAPFLDMAVRALMWGVISYVVVWALAVQVWRHVAVAEVRAHERRWYEHKQKLEEQRQEAHARARAEAEAKQAAARA